MKKRRKRCSNHTRWRIHTFPHTQAQTQANHHTRRSAYTPPNIHTDTHTRTSSKCKLLLSTTIEEVTRFAIVDNDDDDVCVLE